MLFKHKLIKRFNDKTDWPNIDELKEINPYDSQDVVVLDKAEKRYYIFRNAGAAADYFNLSRNTLLRRCLANEHVLTDNLLVKFLKTKGPLTFPLA